MKKANWDLWQKIGYWLVVAVLTVIVGITTISVLEIPKGIKVYTLQSGSMSPVLPTGSLIMVKPIDDYGPGDIITFKSKKDRLNQRPSKTTTHRLIEVRKTEQGIKYLTKGEANVVFDADLIDKDLVLGKVIFSVPLLGFPVAFAKTLPGLIFLIVVPVTIIIYNEILNIKKEITDILRKRKKGKKGEKKRKDGGSLLKLLILLLITCLPGAGKTNSYFIDQESIADNSIASGWWADDTPPESYITDLEPSQTSHQFSIDYYADDPNTSGVKEVSLYYWHTFNEDWQFFSSDVPDADGNGSFEFTSPMGDGVYEFKTEAEDNAGNKEEKFLADDSTQVDTQKPITMLSLGEFGPGRFAAQEILANGNFEDTLNPDSGWTSGGDGDHQIIDDPAIVRDNNSFLIGFRDTDLTAFSNLPASDFLFQDIDLPAGGSATLSFWYRLVSEDMLDYDWFQALILDPTDGSLLAKIAHNGVEFFRGLVTDLDWQEVTYNLAGFLGQQIRLYFEVVNTGDRDFGTWAYLDDIRITQGENFVDPVTEISLGATDASGSGVLITEYQIDDGGWQEYVDPFVLPEGEHELAYRSEDINGLVEEEKTIDLTVALANNFLGIVLNQISPRPSGSDQGSSGVPLDGEWVELWNNGASPIDVNGWVLYDADDGKLPVSVANSDNNGNFGDEGETIIASGSWLKIYRNGDSDFTLHDNGDTVELYTNYKTSGGVLIDSFAYGTVGSDDKTWKRTPDGTGTWADPPIVILIRQLAEKDLDFSALPQNDDKHEGFEVEFGFREDKKAVWFEVVDVSSFNSLQYEIVYGSQGGERGIIGEIEIGGQEKIRREDLLLGTCSSLGEVCVYDQGVSKVQLKISLVSKDGEEEEIQKEILY